MASRTTFVIVSKRGGSLKRRPVTYGSPFIFGKIRLVLDVIINHNFNDNQLWCSRTCSGVVLVRDNRDSCLSHAGHILDEASAGSSKTYSEYHKFILSFDVNDERFYEILLPQNYLDGFDGVYRQCLTVFKGSLALIVFSCTLPLD
uniref:Uncharacterized protein n=1 Tax=Quercus lobata TaxID=97700 RepID=A0A7N2M0J6_QUELO